MSKIQQVAECISALNSMANFDIGHTKQTKKQIREAMSLCAEIANELEALQCRVNAQARVIKMHNESVEAFQAEIDEHKKDTEILAKCGAIRIASKNCDHYKRLIDGRILCPVAKVIGLDGRFC